MMMPLGTVPYAQTTASLEVAPPYHFPGVIVHGFVIDVSLKQVQKYYDSTFNLGDQKERGFVYRTAPAWPYGLLLFAQYPRMLCASRGPDLMRGIPSYAARGSVCQNEVFLAIPAVRYGTTKIGAILDTTVDWALPFMVVENASSASCGREMIGLGKVLADVEIGEGKAPGGFSAAVSFPGWKTGAEDELQEPLEFVRILTEPPMPTNFGKDPRTTPMGLLRTRAGSALAEGWSSFIDLAERASLGTLPLDMRTVSLKQFRAAEDPERAIFQSLVTCRSQYSDVSDFRVFNDGDVSIDFNTYASFRPILKIFIDPAKIDPPKPPHISRIGVTCRAAYSMTSTIDFDEMRTIFIRPIDPGPGNAWAQPDSDLVAAWARPWVGLFAKAPQ